MGERATETVREIQDLRDSLESKLRVLEDRIPAPALWAGRAAGLAVGGGLGGSVFWFAVRRATQRRRRKAPVQAVVQVVPPRWLDELPSALADPRVRRAAVLAGAAWTLVRLAELRQLRRIAGLRAVT